VRIIAPNPATAIPAVKAAIRSYRASESSARDLISTIWSTVDQKLDETAGVVNALVDLMEEEDKKSDVLSSWNGFRIEVWPLCW
jgi:E3 ubiquitin-protein ligase ZNF598